MKTSVTISIEDKLKESRIRRKVNTENGNVEVTISIVAERGTGNWQLGPARGKGWWIVEWRER